MENLHDVAHFESADRRDFFKVAALKRARQNPVAIFIISYGGGMRGLYWARGESAFLNKPDPPEAPQLWKFRE
jgi:hypothetical protein